MLGDIRNPRWLCFKAILLLAAGLLASTILLLQTPNLRTVLLLCIAIWAFCRVYYFALYVIEHYVDPTYRFAGLMSFVRYTWSQTGVSAEESEHDSQAQIR
jgi:hypothetical protein